MSANRLRIDLVKLIRQTVDQLAGSAGNELLRRWLEQAHEQPQIIEFDLGSVQPEPGTESFCPRCGYETIEVHGNQALCRTCGLRWKIGTGSELA